MSGDGKRGGAQAPVLAPILDSTKVTELPLRWVASRISMYGNAVYRSQLQVSDLPALRKGLLHDQALTGWQGQNLGALSSCGVVDALALFIVPIVYIVVEQDDATWR
jgi:hypothetical protein